MKKFLAAVLFFFVVSGAFPSYARDISTQQKIAGLYVAFFNRAPDLSGLTYWTNKADTAQTNGQDVNAVFKALSAGFATHPVFTSTYGSKGNEAFARAIYINVLGQAGDEEGIAYWTQALNNNLSRSDMVASFVGSALTVDLTPAAFPTLSENELDAAKLRQDLITYKTQVAIAFVDQLKEKTNVTSAGDPENDPAYQASIKILAGINQDPSTLAAATGYLGAIAGDTAAMEKILSDWNPAVSSSVQSCIINTRYKDNSPSDGICIENLPEDQCEYFTYSADTYDNTSFMEDGTCVSLGFPAESKFESADLTDTLRDWYFKDGLYTSDTSSEPVYIDWELDASAVSAQVQLPENSPLAMADAAVEVILNDYVPDAGGQVSIKTPQGQITDAYVMLQDPSSGESVTYLMSTVLPEETDVTFSAGETAVSLVLNGISHTLLTDSGTPQAVKAAIRQNSASFIQSFTASLTNDPYWLRTENLTTIYADPVFVQAVSDSKNALETMMADTQRVLYAQDLLTSPGLTVLPAAELNDFAILPRRTDTYVFKGDMTGDLVIENDTMLPARYKATNLFTKMPIHTPNFGVFGDLISPQSSLLYGFYASNTSVNGVDFQPSKITIYTPGWGYLPHDTPEYNYIKSMNRALNERVLLDNIVAVVGSLIPVVDKHVYLKMLQWLSKQSFFRTAMDEYYGNNGQGDLKSAIKKILTGLQNWENLEDLMKIPADYYSKESLKWLAQKAKWIGKITSAQAGIWIYAADLASTEADLMITPPYINFTQVSFPVFLKTYDPDSIDKVATTDESRRVTLTGEGLWPPDSDPSIKLEARNTEGEYDIFTITKDKIHEDTDGIWFDLPFSWLNTGSDIVGPIYFRLTSSFTDNETFNLITNVNVPPVLRDDYYKININSLLSITSLSTARVTRKDALTLFGKGFSQTISDNHVWFTDNTDKTVEAVVTYSTGDYIETIVPEGLAIGPLWVEVTLKDGNKSNEKTLSLIPKMVTASPTNATDDINFKDPIQVSLSQPEGLPVSYCLDNFDKDHALSYAGPLTMNKTTTVFAFSRVVVEGINYDSDIAGGGYLYYMCAQNEDFVDGQCVSQEVDRTVKILGVTLQHGWYDTSPYIFGRMFDLPLNISKSGDIIFDHVVNSSTQLEERKWHLWGTGTWNGTRLTLNGTWTMEATGHELAGYSPGYLSHSDLGTFIVDTSGFWDEPLAVTQVTTRHVVAGYEDDDPPYVYENNTNKPEFSVDDLTQLKD